MAVGMGPVDALIRKTDARGRFTYDNLPADARAELLVSAPGHATLFTLLPNAREMGQYEAGRTDIRIALPPEGRVEGTVVNKATGLPVVGVKVMAAAAANPMPFAKPAVSDARGRFAIGGLTSIGHRLYATPDPQKHADLVAATVIVDVMAGETASDVVIELFEGGVVEVVVTDENDNSPVKKAHVQLTGGASPITSGMTDDKGVARISLAPGEYTVQMVYAMPRYDMRQVGESVTVVAGKGQWIEVQLTPTPKVTGTVSDPDGEPVEGAIVTVLPNSGQVATSNAQGEFEVNLGAGWGGRAQEDLVLMVCHAGRDLAAAMGVEADATDPVAVKLVPGAAVAGQVVDPKGQPIANAAVHVALRSASWSASLLRSHAAKTDADGRYEIKALPSGRKAQVSATATGFGATQVDIDLAEAVDRRVEAPPVTLKLANMSIAGTVVDEDDKPVAEAFVSVTGQGQTMLPARQTDAKGKFTIDKLCEGTVRISVIVQSPKQMWADQSAKAGDQNVKIALASQQQRRVVAPTPARSLAGKPLPDLGKLNVAAAAVKRTEGKAVLVAFFDVRQRPSRHYLKKLVARTKSLQDQGLAVILVQAAPVEPDEMQQMADKLGVEQPLAVMKDDIDKTRAAWAVKGMPWFILADAEHTVRADDFSFDELDEKLETIAGK